MARACTVCTSSHRDQIDEGLVGGRSHLSLAGEFGVNRSSIRRHAANHLPLTLARVTDRVEDARGMSLLERIENLYERANAILIALEQSGRAAQALAGVRELRAICELLGRATGELRDSPTTVVNIIGSNEWTQIRSALLAALESHPAARQAVAGRLLELEAGGS